MEGRQIRSSSEPKIRIFSCKTVLEPIVEFEIERVRLNRSMTGLWNCPSPISLCIYMHVYGCYAGDKTETEDMGYGKRRLPLINLPPQWFV
jgi:hypothetical protein